LVVLALAEGELLDAGGLDELGLGGFYRAAAGERGDQGYLVPAGLVPQPGGGFGGQQQILGDVCCQRGHPWLAVEGSGQVQAVHGEFQDACAQELGEQHAVAVAGLHDTP
jgi:hypothetical protein